MGLHTPGRKDRQGKHHHGHPSQELEERWLKQRWVTHPIQPLQTNAGGDRTHHDAHGEQTPNQTHRPGAFLLARQVNHQGQVGRRRQRDRQAVASHHRTDRRHPSRNRPSVP